MLASRTFSSTMDQMRPTAAPLVADPRCRSRAAEPRRWRWSRWLRARCVPLNLGFIYNEYERYFGELHLAALLTHADPISASRRAAHTLGIPIIEVVTRPHDGARRVQYRWSGAAAPMTSLRPALTMRSYL